MVQLPKFSIKYDDLYKFVMSVGVVMSFASIAVLLYSISIGNVIIGIVLAPILLMLGLKFAHWALVRWRVKQRIADRLEIAELELANKKVKTVLKEEYSSSLLTKEDPIEHTIDQKETS